MRRAGLVGLLLVTVACSDATADGTPPPAPLPTAAAVDFPPAPDAPTGDNPEATRAFEEIAVELAAGILTRPALDEFVAAADVRHAWLLSDVLRFVGTPAEADNLLDAFEQLTGVDAAERVTRSPWNAVTDLLIAWDTPAPPEYRRLKGTLFTIVEPGWAPFFDDPDATIDFRWLSWGGVFIDDRPLGDQTDPTSRGCGARGCIPALDDPELVPAAEGDWYDDDAIVFGITVGDEAVALPKNIMQVHEMVNMTIDDRRFGIPYCTLCGSAQAFATDRVPDGVEVPVLRTSGLLNRSNKVMYDLVTGSAFDTFTGAAVSGPLREAGVVLPQETVTVSTWGEWRDAYPDTTIIAEDGGIGRSYDDDPLRGRDDDGPIFPIGDLDPRLGAQAPVLGVVLDDGTTIGFAVDALRSATADGPVVYEGVTVEPDAGGFRASVDGEPVPVHEAFWFAWSQFHPDTLLWP